MILSAIFVVFSGVATFAGILPYLIDVIKGKTKPRVVSWFIWSCLSAISFFAAIAEKQYPTAVLMGCSLLTTVLVVIVGWKKAGRGKIKALDIICLSGAVIGLVLWVIFNSPSAAVIAMVCVDFIGGIPTQVHCWKKPNEETLSMFAMSCLGALFTLLAINEWRITAFAFPLFLFVINIEYALVITSRRWFIENKKR